MNITLIIPPSPFLLDERVFVSLGVLRIAAVLERDDHAVKVLDLSGIENYLDALRAYLASPPRRLGDSPYQTIGITATTPQMPAVMAIARAIRGYDGHQARRLILGGPHVTLVWAARKLEVKRGSPGRAHRALDALDEFNVLVAGDGELAIGKALAPLAPSIIDADDHKGPLFMSDSTYAESPMPARHLIDMSTYRYSIEGHPATSLIAQLGCPFACGFCGGRSSKMLRVIRTRPAKVVVAEMQLLYLRYGYTGFMFYDDELNVNKSMIELMDAITALRDRLGVEFRLRGFIKAELFNDAQAEAMYRAGFRWLLCGFEAANERILVNINKRATLADNTRAVEIARKHGLKIKALMSVGHPGESRESIEDVRDWLIDMRVDDFDCTIITTYPGTPYYDEAVETYQGIWTYTHPKTGDRLHAYDVDFTEAAGYYKGVPGDYRSYVFTDHLHAHEIVRWRDAVERDVRAALKIPANPSRAAQRYEHSMGMGLPQYILRGVENDSGCAPQL